MKYLKYAFRRLSKKGEHSLARIVSLIAGLAFGILLLSEVFYYYSFDSFYPDADRIYTVYENFKMDRLSDKVESFPKVSGAIAPGLKAEVPGVEAATRLNSMGTSVFYTEDKKKYKAKFSLADEHVFDVLPRPVITGNPKEIMKVPMKCMVSDKIAEMMGGNVIGKVIELKEYPQKKFEINGIFGALPENAGYKYDVLISMASTSQLFSFDGTDNWLGNDRYYACVKLAKGVTPESLAPAVRKMQEKNQDIVKLEQAQAGMIFKYSFQPITKIRAADSKDMIIILSAIAFAVLFVSFMNYILLTLSALMNRAKTSAIYKTCGALSRNLYQLILSESLLVFIISIVGAIILILLLNPFVENLFGHSMNSLLNTNVIVPILLVITFLAFLIGYLPGRFYAKIPVTTVFRNFVQKRKRWKLVLLSSQFCITSFILTALVIISMQYNKMSNADHGYKVENIYFGSTSGMTGNNVLTLLNKLKSTPDFDKVGLGFNLPINGASGNNIRLPNEDKDLFNVADFYWIDDNYLSILDIPVTSGNTFSSASSVPNDVLISKKGAGLLQLNTGWKDGVIDKQIIVTEHGSATIKGVFPDFIISSIASPDKRPSLFLYMPTEKIAEYIDQYPSRSFNVLIKAHGGSVAMNIEKLTKIFNSCLPHQDAVVMNLENEQKANYEEELGFRNAMMAGNFVILLISVLGLLGYTANEASRRTKELAIRRMSGANLSNILQMFIYDLECILVPAVVIGLVGAWFIANKWMMNFADKIPLHWGIFAGCSLFIMLFVALIAAINYTRVANRNPVEALRHE